MAQSAFKIALIGAGRMGTIHARNAAAHPRLDPTWLVEPRAAEAEKLCAELGCRPSTLAAALADPDLSGVIIASSTDTHLDLALAALRAGKAVFCEKPLDLDVARLRANAAAFEGAGAPLQVAFNRRFDPHFQALKAKIAAGAIGDLESLLLISHDPKPPPAAFIPTSGGLFRDFTIHDFDVARWLMEEEPSEVFAFASCLVDPMFAAADDVDTARVLLKFASGRLCVISNTRRSGCGYDQRVEAYGSQGLAAASNPRTSTVTIEDVAGGRSAPIFDAFPARYAQAYRAEIDHFAEVIAGDAAPVTGFDASLRALALAEAAGQSAKSGAVVRLA